MWHQQMSCFVWLRVQNLQILNSLKKINNESLIKIVFCVVDFQFAFLFFHFFFFVNITASINIHSCLCSHQSVSRYLRAHVLLWRYTQCCSSSLTLNRKACRRESLTFTLIIFFSSCYVAFRSPCFVEQV